ncbi:MAG TPA: hypothetical protein VK421_03330 [Pyrinomonadaceae bacterium]|nr:hypothetical protein [Pyrinomonadaceae bacterium]
MKHKSSRAVLLAALLFGVCLAYGQDASGPRPKRARTPEDYKPRTLKEVSAEGPGAESRGNKEETMLVEGDILPSRVRVKYAGSSRRLPPIKREVLRQWARLYAGSPEGYTKPYETEVLFTEDGAEHWLAVKREALPRFERELKRGGEVDLYLIRLGAAKASGKWEPVLLIESFQKPD